MRVRSAGISAGNDAFTLSTRIQSRIKMPMRTIEMPIFNVPRAVVVTPKVHASVSADDLVPSAMSLTAATLPISAIMARTTPMTPMIVPTFLKFDCDV